MGLKSVDEAMTTLHDNGLNPIEQLREIDATIYQVRGDVYEFVPFPELRTQTEQTLNENIANINKQLGDFHATTLSQEEKDDVAQFDATWAAYQKEIAAVVTQVKTGNEKGALESLKSGGKVSHAREQATASLDKLIDISGESIDEIMKEQDQTVARANITSTLMAVIGGLLAVGLGVVLSRSITGPTSQAVKVIQQMSNGDLSARLQMNRQDEIGVLTRAMDQLADTVNALVADTNALTQAATEGKLATRADASPYQGDFRKIVQGVNDTLDAVVGSVECGC